MDRRHGGTVSSSIEPARRQNGWSGGQRPSDGSRTRKEALMAISSRRNALAMGLALSGVMALVTWAFGQAPRDDAAQQASGTKPANEAGPLVRINTVDMEAVFKGYEKFKETDEVFKAEAQQRGQELMKLADQGR
jgi:hypothetical protein